MRPNTSSRMPQITIGHVLVPVDASDAPLGDAEPDWTLFDAFEPNATVVADATAEELVDEAVEVDEVAVVVEDEATVVVVDLTVVVVAALTVLVVLVADAPVVVVDATVVVGVGGAVTVHVSCDGESFVSLAIVR